MVELCSKDMAVTLWTYHMDPVGFSDGVLFTLMVNL
jgi:hypothetical protein